MLSFLPPFPWLSGKWSLQASCCESHFPHLCCTDLYTGEGLVSPAHFWKTQALPQHLYSPNPAQGRDKHTCVRLVCQIWGSFAAVIPWAVWVFHKPPPIALQQVSVHLLACSGRRGGGRVLHSPLPYVSDMVSSSRCCLEDFSTIYVNRRQITLTW